MSSFSVAAAVPAWCGQLAGAGKFHDVHTELKKNDEHICNEAKKNLAGVREQAQNPARGGRGGWVGGWGGGDATCATW